MAARHPVRELPPDQRPASWLAASESLEIGAADPLQTPPLTPQDEDFTPVCLEPAPFPPVDTSARVGSKPSRADAPPPTITAPARVGAESSLVDTPSRTITAPARVGTESSGFDAASPTITAPARADETRVTLSGPQRYSVQFTASEEYVALVEEARALLAHALPSADIAEVHLRAMQTLVAALKKRKFAVSAREPVQAGASVRSAASVQSTASVRSAEPVGSAEAAPSFPADPTEPPRAVGCNAAHKGRKRRVRQRTLRPLAAPAREVRAGCRSSCGLRAGRASLCLRGRTRRTLSRDGAIGAPPSRAVRAWWTAHCREPFAALRGAQRARRRRRLRA